jgi:hypothetical protein
MTAASRVREAIAVIDHAILNVANSTGQALPLAQRREYLTRATKATRACGDALHALADAIEDAAVLSGKPSVE